MVEEVTNRNLPAFVGPPPSMLLCWRFFWKLLTPSWIQHANKRARSTDSIYLCLFWLKMIGNAWLAILAYSITKRQLPPRSCVHMGIGPIAQVRFGGSVQGRFNDQGSKPPGPVAKHLSFDVSTCAFFQITNVSESPSTSGHLQNKHGTVGHRVPAGKTLPRPLVSHTMFPSPSGSL